MYSFAMNSLKGRREWEDSENFTLYATNTDLHHPSLHIIFNILNTEGGVYFFIKTPFSKEF